MCVHSRDCVLIHPLDPRNLMEPSLMAQAPQSALRLPRDELTFISAEECPFARAHLLRHFSMIVAGPRNG